jgi:hypothetical protein
LSGGASGTTGEGSMTSIRIESHSPHPLIWLFGIFIATFLINGIFFTDFDAFQSIAHDPTHIVVPPDRQFLYSSPINFLVAAAFGVGSSYAAFQIMHFAELILMLLLVGFSVMHMFADRKQQVRFICMLSLTPLWYVTMKWVGKPDPLLIGLFFWCWAHRSPWRIVWVIIMIGAHREMGTLTAFFLYLLEDKKDNSLLYGIALGNGLHVIYQYSVLNQPPQSRAEFMGLHAQDLITVFVSKPGLFIMATLSWYWIVALTEPFRRREWAMLGIAFACATLNFDHTRDFIITAMPPIAFQLARMIANGRHRDYQKLTPLSVLHFQIAHVGMVYNDVNPFLSGLARAISKYFSH